MLLRPVRLFSLFGFSVSLDPSWLILAGLVAWTLSAGFFPQLYPGLPGGVYAWMGAAGALGLFASIVFHELWHSLVARRYGLPMKGITLFVFGGIAEMDEEPPSPKAEALMAAAGPAASLVAGGALWGVDLAVTSAGWPVAVVAVIRYLAALNILLAVFNLLPGFPLDGGRLLRSALWAWKRNLRWATRVASRIGSGFGLAFLALGVARAVMGDVIGGVWWVLIGWFLRTVAGSTYRRLLLKDLLDGQTASDIMDPEPVTVPGGATLDALVQDYFLRHFRRTFPVVEDGAVVGCVTSRRLRGVPRARWAQLRVRDLAEPCGPDNTVAPGTGLALALGALQRSRNDRLLVAQDGRLVGTVEGETLYRELAIRLELEGA